MLSFTFAALHISISTDLLVTVGATAAGVVAGAAVGVIGVKMVVCCLGFRSSGILAESEATYLMSSSAIAHGGGVPAGGCVAVCQSLGTGLGCPCTTCVALIGGAVGGVVAYYTTIHIMSNKQNQTLSYEQNQTFSHEQNQTLSLEQNQTGP